MVKQINGLKWAPLLAALFLTACGGGGGGSNSKMDNTLNLSGVVESDSGKNIFIESNVSIVHSSVTKHVWSIAQVSGGAVTADTSPTIIDATCTYATNKPGVPSSGSNMGTTGSSICATSIVIPSTAKPGEWVVKNSATAGDGSSSSASFNLKIKEKPPSVNGFTLNIPNTPQLQEVKKLAQLSISYNVNPGVTVDSVKYSWSQSGLIPVNLAAATTATPSFIANTVGEYVFRAKVTITVAGKEETQEGDIVVNVSEPVPLTYFEVSAGDVQVGKVGVPVQLSGKVTGNAPAGSLSYEWTQVSGPQQAIFANEKTMSASFIPEIGGTYVFQLKASNSEGFKTATTTVAIEIGQGSAPFFIVSAGDAQLSTPGVVTTLKGTVAVGNPPPVNITYFWEQTAGSPITLANPTTLQASFIAVNTGTYGFKLTAISDGVEKNSNTIVLVKP